MVVLLFSKNTAPVESKYKGAQSVSARYLGVRTEAQLNVGPTNLWP